MEFQFESLTALFWMKGHGPYVWVSYGITLAGITLLAVLPGQQRKQLFKLLRASKKRKAGSADISTPTSKTE